MEQIDSGESNSTNVDPIALSSDVGTWAAAFVAIVALVGIIGPYLALQASLSDENRAMNAVQDLPQKYISRGFRLSKRLRIFRRICVPDLSLAYIGNGLDTVPLIPSAAAGGRWTLHARDYLPWNTGWAKLAELIEAYELRDSNTDSPKALDIPQGSGLEVVNSRTAPVVSKHWILILGLLDRYGTRRDKGILHKKGIRREFTGERAEIRHFRVPKHRSHSHHHHHHHHDMEDENSETDHSCSSSSFSDSTSRSRTSRRFSINEKIRLEVRRGPFGEMTFENMGQSIIHGINGTFQTLGRQRGSWSRLTAVSFVPHTAREILGTASTSRTDRSTLQTQFWLAHGFLPLGSTAEGKPIVVSLEGPDPEEVIPNPSCLSRHFVNGSPAFSLQESDDIPISIGNAMRALAIEEPVILQFLPMKAMNEGQQTPIEKQDRDSDTNSGKIVDTDAKGGRDAISDYSSDRWLRSSVGVRADGKWAWLKDRETLSNIVFPRKDLDRVATGILSLDCDDWGYLIRRDWLLSLLLKDVSNILHSSSAYRTDFGTAFSLTSMSNSLKWTMGRPLKLDSTLDYLQFNQFLADSLEATEMLPIRNAIGILMITDGDFRQQIKTALSRYIKRSSYDDPVSPLADVEKEIVDAEKRARREFDELQQMVEASRHAEDKMLREHEQRLRKNSKV